MAPPHISTRRDGTGPLCASARGAPGSGQGQSSRTVSRFGFSRRTTAFSRWPCPYSLVRLNLARSHKRTYYSSLVTLINPSSSRSRSQNESPGPFPIPPSKTRDPLPIRATCHASPSSAVDLHSNSGPSSASSTHYSTVFVFTSPLATCFISSSPCYFCSSVLHADR